VPRRFRNLKKWQAGFQPLSSRIPASKKDAYSEAWTEFTEAGDIREISPGKEARITLSQT
jgi:hypothetical protein